TGFQSRQQRKSGRMAHAAKNGLCLASDSEVGGWKQVVYTFGEDRLWVTADSPTRPPGAAQPDRELYRGRRAATVPQTAADPLHTVSGGTEHPPTGLPDRLARLFPVHFGRTPHSSTIRPMFSISAWNGVMIGNLMVSGRLPLRVAAREEEGDRSTYRYPRYSGRRATVSENWMGPRTTSQQASAEASLIRAPLRDEKIGTPSRGNSVLIVFPKSRRSAAIASTALEWKAKFTGRSW